jgi:hypothetical protein
MGLSVNPILKMCRFKLHCPVSSPVTHRKWFLFSSNNFLVLLAAGPCRNPFAFLRRDRKSQYFYIHKLG